MAKASGPIRISGKLGDLVFYIRDGEQHVKLASDMRGKRMKKYDKNDKRTVTRAIRMGLNYYATSLYRLMKYSGLKPSKNQFNEFKNEIYYRIIGQLKAGEPIKASVVKQLIHGYEWKNNDHGSTINVQQENGLIKLLVTHGEKGPWATDKKYQINMYRTTLDDLYWNGEKYNYTLPGKIPVHLQEEWICTQAEPSFEIPIDELKENEFIVMSVLPMLDEFYPMQSGASVWVF